MRSEEGGPLAFGKPLLADVAVKEAVQEAVLLLFAVAVADREVPHNTEGVFGAGGILAAEAGEIVVHIVVGPPEKSIRQLGVTSRRDYESSVFGLQ
jgi:ribosomal protein S5